MDKYDEYFALMHPADYRYFRQAPKRRFEDEYFLDFGKHSGKSVKEVPIDYLEWLAEKGGEEASRHAARETRDRRNRDRNGTQCPLLV